MDKYRKVRSEREAVPDGIIRVNRNIQARVFIDQVLDEFNKNNKDSVCLSSLGEAITKSVTIAEIVKHRVPGLHTVNEISTIVIDDEYEPVEEGLDKMTVSRKLTCLQITLSKTAPKNTKVPGYQEPIPASEVNPEAGPEDDGRQNNARRGGGRRPRTGANTDKPANDNATPSGDDKKPADSRPARNNGEEAKEGGRRRRPRGGSGNRRGGRGGGDHQVSAQEAGAGGEGQQRRGGRGPRDGGHRDGGEGQGQRRGGDGQRRGGRGGNRDGGDETRGGDGNRRGGNRDGGNRDGGDGEYKPRGRRGGRGGNRDGGAAQQDPYAPVERK